MKKIKARDLKAGDRIIKYKKVCMGLGTDNSFVVKKYLISEPLKESDIVQMSRNLFKISYLISTWGTDYYTDQCEILIHNEGE